MKGNFYISDSVEVLEQKRTPQGGLKVRARIARKGLLKYYDEKGNEHWDLRSLDEIKSKEYLDSVHTSPMTNDHPKTFVNSLNWQKTAVGHALAYPEIEDETYVTVDLHIVDEDAIQSYLAGRSQLSVGLTANRIMEKGEWDGKPYNGRQVNLRNNHIALVDKGRAGPECSIVKILDEKDEPRMKIKINGVEFELEKEICDAIDAERKANGTELDELKDYTKSLKTRADKAEGKLEILESKIKDSETDVSAIQEKAKAIAGSFIKVYSQATQFLDSEELKPFYESFDSSGIQKAIIKKHYPSIELKDKSDDKIEGMFELIVSQASDENNKKRSKDIGKTFLDSKTEDGILDARSKALAKAKEKSTSPLKN